MNTMENTLADLNGMLKIYDKNIKNNSNHVMMVHKDSMKQKMLYKGQGQG
jgi:hypothetical protein